MNMDGINNDKEELPVKDEVLVREDKTTGFEAKVPMGQRTEDCLKIVDNMAGYNDVEGVLCRSSII